MATERPADARAAARDLRALETLLASRGWALLREIMEKEVLAASRAIAGSASMPIDEIHFRRGAIWAGTQLLEMPQRVRMRLEADVALAAPNPGPAHPQRKTPTSHGET